MPLNIGKINLGISSKKNHFDWSHDVNTTSDFGFCQPTLIKSLIPNTKVSLKTNTFTRLAPLPAPLFGRIKMKQYTQFIPMNDVFPAFGNMQNQTSIRTSVADYIPTTADTIRNDKLLNLIIGKSLQYLQNSFTDSTSGLSSLMSDWFKCFFIPGISIDYIGTYAGDAPISINGDWFDGFSSDVLQEEISNDLTAEINTYLGTSYTSMTKGFVLENLLLMNLKETYNGSTLGTLGSDIYDLLETVFGSTSFGVNAVKELFLNNQNSVSLNYRSFPYNSHYYNVVKPVISTPRSSSSSDFVFKLDHTVKVKLPKYDWSDTERYDCMVSFCLRLTPQGKRFFKILTASGINFGIQKDIELTKLFAFYKAWFDQMNTGRLLDWKMTNAYKVIHTFYDCGITLSQMYNDSSLDVYGQKDNFVKFLYDLANCFYTLPVDPITVATPTQYQVNSANDVNVVLTDAEHSYSLANTAVGNSVHSSTDNILSALQVQALLRFQKIINKDSVIGKKVDSYLQSHFGYKLEHTNFIGKNEFMCDVSDVLGTVNNDETQLGEYAGKGIGSGSTDKMHFESNDFGYLIQFMCIVPLGGYVQASSPTQIKRLDFYRAEYDSLGMESLPQSEVLSRQFCFKDRIPTDKVFGWRPRFFSQKYVNNLNNGDFAFPSQRQSFLCYNLDRIFTETTPTTDAVKLSADDSLRTIGQYEFMGNYNRIFYDTSGTVDNFIVHLIHELHVYSPMKAITNSFDTFDDQTDNDTTQVVHQ